jgi:hypothetical protein
LRKVSHIQQRFSKVRAQLTHPFSFFLSVLVLITMGSLASRANTFDGPAELPRVYVQSTMANTPAPGKTITVPAGGSLQTAINNASCGDTIQLQAGAAFVGFFTLPAKPCDNQHWIIIRTSAPNSALPPEGTRATPCLSGVTSLPGRPALNCKSTAHVMAQVVYQQPFGSGPFALAPGANHYRLMGLEITRKVGTGFVAALVFAHGGGTANHIVIDRDWLHGTPQDETTVAVSLAGMTNVAVVDSYINDFHCTAIVGSCTDAHAVSGGVGTLPGGPYEIVDNFLEASGENILFGGGYATTTPADIEIRRNHFFKPLQWMPGAVGFVGGAGGYPFVAKNHLELKNAQRVQVEANIMENSWGGFSQVGYSILLTPKNQSLSGTNLCPICQVTDVTIRYTTISHVAGGFQIANALSDLGGIPLAGERYSIHDVIVDDINPTKFHGPGNFVELFTAQGAPALQQIQIEHVTAFPPHTMITVGNSNSNPTMKNFTFANNLTTTGPFPIWSTGGTTNCAFPDTPLATLTACFTPFSFTHNALIGVPLNNFPPALWPSGNFFPSTTTTAMFMNYNSGVGGNYQLQVGSPYKNAGTDGKDLGANVTGVQAATAGVL